MSLPCPHDGCPGLEMHDGKPDGCGHGTVDHGCMAVAAERDGLRLACQVLAAMVRDEFPNDMTLAEVCGTWSPFCGPNPTREQIAALRELQGSL